MPERTGPRRGVIIGCGGTLGFAWSAVALQTLERRLGWDARTAAVLVGTSAGSEAVALLGAGRSVDTVVAALHGSTADSVLAAHLAVDPGRYPPLPRPAWPARGLLGAALSGETDLVAGLLGLLPRGGGDPGWLHGLGEQLAGPEGWVSHPATWLVAADASTGRRVAFGSPEAPRIGLGEAIAASWAIPGWFPPVRAAGRDYVDGGTVSTASADLVAGLALDEVYVLAPMATAEPVRGAGPSRAERWVRRRMTRGLDGELAVLEAAGTRVIRIEPGQEDLDAMGFNFMDRRRRSTVLATAGRTAPARIDRALDQGATR